MYCVHAANFSRRRDVTGGPRSSPPRQRRASRQGSSFPSVLVERLLKTLPGRGVEPLLNGQAPSTEAIRALLKKQSDQIRTTYKTGLDEEKSVVPPHEYIKQLKKTRSALRDFCEIPARNYILNSDGVLKQLGHSVEKDTNFPVQFGENLREHIMATLHEAQRWLDLLNLHADNVNLSGKRGISSPALWYAEFSICFFAGFWKSRCGLSVKEFHDLAEAFWIAADLPNKGNAREGNTLRSFIVKAMKRQKNHLEKLAPILHSS